MDTPVKPNDVVVILRPNFEEEKEWDGCFEILIGGFGPVTMPADNMRELVSMAMLIGTTVQIMEQDAKFTERIMEECAKYYGEPDDVMDSKAPQDDDFVLTIHTKTVGGMQ
jgi:hypothetical protein